MLKINSKRNYIENYSTTDKSLLSCQLMDENHRSTASETIYNKPLERIKIQDFTK